MRPTPWLCGALAALALVAGCGGDDDAADSTTAATTSAATGATTGQTAPADATAAIQAAYERLRTESYRATVDQTVSIDAGDAPEQVQTALSATEGTTTSEIEAENGARVRGTVDTPQLPQDVTVVIYDGATYITTGDSEFARLGGDLGDLFADLAGIGSEELAQALENVTDEGPATVDGREVQRYSADLSEEFTDDLTDRVLSGFGVPSSQVDLSVTEASLTVDLLPDGGMAHQRTTTTIEIDLSELAGSEVVVTQTTEADQSIRDAGAPITVAPPETSTEVTTLTELGQFLS